MLSEEALRMARILWEYARCHQEPVPADVIIALGTNDLRVAEFAAGLYLRGFGQNLLCSGGIAHTGEGDLLATSWDRSEAEMYADVAEGCGVPRDRILLETRATNTSENISFARELLTDRGLYPRSIVIAAKPFVGRRTWAILAKLWPEMPATIASPDLTLDEYFTEDLTPDKVINTMVGDVQRIWVYAQRGWSAPQPIPVEVKEAFDGLLALGFTKRLIAP